MSGGGELRYSRNVMCNNFLKKMHRIHAAHKESVDIFKTLLYRIRNKI
jgi:hypothetical protein